MLVQKCTRNYLTVELHPEPLGSLQRLPDLLGRFMGSVLFPKKGGERGMKGRKTGRGEEGGREGRRGGCGETSPHSIHSFEKSAPANKYNVEAYSSMQENMIAKQVSRRFIEYHGLYKSQGFSLFF